MDKSNLLRYKWEAIWAISAILLLVLPLTAIFFIMIFILAPMFGMAVMAVTNEGFWAWTEPEKWPWKRLSLYLGAVWIAASFIILTDGYSPSSGGGDDWWCNEVNGEKECYRQKDIDKMIP